jgi:enediyne biosynthesis protein E4
MKSGTFLKMLVPAFAVGMLVFAGLRLLRGPATPPQDAPPATKPAARATAGSTAVTPPVPAGPDDLFEDVTERSGIRFVHQFCDTKIANILESNGAGGCWLDYDGDGLPDLFLVNSGPLDGVTHHKPGTPRQPNRLYRNRGDGTFEDVTEKAGLAGAGFCSAAVAADYDNDGHTDLFVAAVGRSCLYHNRGDGTFEDVTEKAGVANVGGTALGAVFFDADNDGKLDLFVANYLTYDPNYQLYYNPDAYPGPLAYKPQLCKLYRNHGDGRFEDVSEASGVQISGHRAMSAAVFDCNNDGAPDLYISNDGTPNLLLVNDGKGHFKDTAAAAAVAFNAMGEAAGSMAAAVGDCNNDGIQDILVTRFGYGSLYMGTARGFFDDRMMASGLGALTAQFVGWGGCFLDAGNAGKLDIFIANGDPHYLVGWECLFLENNGAGAFSDGAGKAGAWFKTKIRGRGAAVADYDNDGRMDVVVTALADRPFLLHNRGKDAGHWLTFDLQGVRSNRDGFGAKVRVTAGGKTQTVEARCAFGFLMQSDRRVHFGLGPAGTAEKVTIRWPSGITQELADVKADQILKVREPSPGKVAE